MDTKKMFEEYWNNKAKIVLCENLIENRKNGYAPVHDADFISCAKRERE